MDRARATIAAPEVSGARGGGQGVVIGVVDSGVDVTHPDLRASDGRTRVAWLFDFFVDPDGSQPELEARYGCEAEDGLRCRILSAVDIDERLSNGIDGDEPGDDLGHGTHVAAIAAGNGSANPALMGVAPEATLIVVGATGRGTTLSDSDIVLGAQFVFERAEELGMPAVVNLSLGSDFGPHGEQGELGRALAALVGPEHPGRAIVVAAGNSGSLLLGLATGVEEPLGIHTAIDVADGGSSQLALLTPPPADGADTTDATIYVWLELSPGMRVGFSTPDGQRIEPVPPGELGSLASEQLEVAVLNGTNSEAALSEWREDAPLLAQTPPVSGSAVIFIDGRWPAGQSFGIELEGGGHAELWLQSEGDLGPGTHATGALFPRATASGTVTLPAAHPGLIAVGASVNRLSWLDRTGREVTVRPIPNNDDWLEGAAAFFSSGGPNSEGRMKPELTAPGALVISALALQADPRRELSTVFASGSLCDRILDCQIVDSRHAVTAGTSMAAPMVSGAVALLLEQQPRLTQSELRDRLQSGARGAAHPDPSRDGVGTLNIGTSLDAASGGSDAAQPDAVLSRLVLARDSALSDPTRPFELLLQLRDGDDRPLAADPARLRLQLRGGVVVEELAASVPGLYRALIAATAGRAELVVDVLFDDGALLSQSLPITGAPGSVERDSGCSVTSSSMPRSQGAYAALLALLGACTLRSRALRSRPDTR